METGASTPVSEPADVALVPREQLRHSAFRASSHRHWRWSTVERLIALTGAGLGLIALCLVAYALRNVYVGDAAVYLPYAQHAAAGHLFQFNPGQFSSGATSPLWAVLLAIPYVFGLGLAGAKAFAFAAVLGAILAVAVATVRLGGSPSAAAVIGIFLIAAMGWYALVLYESALVIGVVAVSLVIVGDVLRKWDRGSLIRLRSLAPLVAIWAVLPLARPDASLVAVAEALAIVFSGRVDRRRAGATTAAALALAAIPAMAYYGYSLVHLGTLSTSASERTFALHEGAHRWLGPLYLSTDALHQLFATFWVLITVPGLVGLGLLARTRPTRWIGVTGGLLLLAYLLLLTFVSPGLTDTPRYLVPVIPLLAVGSARCLSALRSEPTRVVAVCVSLGLIGGLAISDVHHRAVWLRSLGLSSNEVFERDVVARINALAHPGDTLLAYEVQLRYYLRDDVSVLSEDGITDAKVRPYQTPAGITTFLRRYQPRWWIADNDVAVRKYMRGSVLDQVFTAFKRHPALAHRSVDGITFDLVARRSRPLAPGFGGWQILFRLSYPK
jgi:hypothetical protein